MTAWRIVPTEPTEAMDAAFDATTWPADRQISKALWEALRGNMRKEYAAMLNAAPEPDDELIERMTRAFVDHDVGEQGYYDGLIRVSGSDYWEVIEFREAMRAAITAIREGR